MELTTTCKSPRDAYTWLDEYYKLNSNEQVRIKNLILKNQYNIFLKHIVNISKYQLINKLDELLKIFSKSELQVFFNKFGLELTNKIFWLNSQSSLNYFFINYLELCSNKNNILEKYEQNKKILSFFYELSKFTLTNDSDINIMINFLKSFSHEIRFYLLSYGFDFPDNNLYKQNFLTALVALHYNSKLDRIFSEPDLLSKNNKQKLLSYIDENNNSLVHTATQYNNLKGLVFVLTNINSNFIKRIIITKKLGYLNSNKIFTNNGLSPIHIAILNNNLDILKFLLSGFTSKSKYKLITKHKIDEFALNHPEQVPYELAILNNNAELMHFLSTNIPFFYKNNFRFLIFKNVLNNIDDIIKIPFSNVMSYLYLNKMISQKNSNLLSHNNDFSNYYESEVESINNIIEELMNIINKNNKFIDAISTLIKEIIQFQICENKIPEIIFNFKLFLKENLHFITTDESRIREIIDEIYEDLEKDPIDYLNNISKNLSNSIKYHKEQNILLTVIYNSPDKNNLQNKLSLLNIIKKNLSNKYQLVIKAEKSNNSLNPEIPKPKVLKRKDPVVFFIDFSDQNNPNLTACRSSESMENLSRLCSDTNLDNESCKYKMGQLIEPFIKLYKNNYDKISVILETLELKLTNLLKTTKLTEQRHKQSFEGLNEKYNIKLKLKKHC